MLYGVQFTDGEIKEYSANLIDNNMQEKVNAEDHVWNMKKVILDYKKDAYAIEKEEIYTTTKYDQCRMQHTALGWKLLVQWKNRTEKWTPLK